MGLDMYLGRYHKTTLEKTTFNAEESETLRDFDNSYEIFKECPKPFINIATEIKLINEYYDMKKISETFANGETLTIGSYGCGKIGFRNYEKDIKLDLDANMIHKDYILQKEETSYVVEGDYEVAYWRKANQIRQWFVNHIEEFNSDDNCEYYKITKELLVELITDCKAVLNNHDLATELIPTSSGFYFGSTEYDEWYYKDLEDTIKMCEDVIETTDWDNEVVVYTESW